MERVDEASPPFLAECVGHFLTPGKDRYTESNEDGVDFLYSSVDSGLSMKGAIAVMDRPEFREWIDNDDLVNSMCRAAQFIAQRGPGQGATLQDTYKEAFPGDNYDPPKAKAALARLPILCVKNRVKGGSKSVYDEYVVYERLENGFPDAYAYMAKVYHSVAEKVLADEKNQTFALTPDEIKAALDMCGSAGKLKNALKWCIQKASGLSNRRFGKDFGINMTSAARKATSSTLWEINDVRLQYEEDLKAKEEKFLESCGTTAAEFQKYCDEHAGDDDYMVDDEDPIDVVQDENMSESESDSEDDEQESEKDPEEQEFEKDPEEQQFDDELMMKSLNDAVNQREKDVILNVIVDDDDDDDDEGVDKFRRQALLAKTEDEYIEAVKQGRAKIIRRLEYRRKMLAAEKTALKRPRAYVGKLRKDFPGVGKFLEDVCKESQIGADRWRRTGHLTLEQGIGVGKIGSRLTFKTMKKRIEEHYVGQIISLSSVKRLCIARNARHRSSSWYLGWAGIVSRKVKKGRPQLFNPDAHWSASFYLGLDHLYFATDEDKSVVNRDDQAGKRLHSTFDNSSRKSMMMRDKPTLTTTSDYLFAEIKGAIQPSNYLSTGFRCHGAQTRLLSVVKANEVHPKSPMQHYTDLCDIVTDHPKMKDCFYNSQGNRKKIELLMVDGGPDENPEQGGVRLYHVMRHVQSESYLHVVTARAAGSSRLNPVERFNGNMGNAINNVFIPATLLGSHGTPGKDDYDHKKFKENMVEAIDMFCLIVKDSVGFDGVPISTVRPPFCTDDDAIRCKYFMKYAAAAWNKSGTPAAMNKVMRECDNESGSTELSESIKEKFSTLDKIYNNHWVYEYQGVDMPKYIFTLRCCWKRDCPHPACQAAGGTAPQGWDWKTRKWSPNDDDSAPMMFFPFPRVDTTRPATRKETIQGQRIRLHGLTGGKAQFNGRKGICTEYDSDTCTVTLYKTETHAEARAIVVPFTNVTSTEGTAGMIHGKGLLEPGVESTHPTLLIEVPSDIIARAHKERDAQASEQTQAERVEWIESLCAKTALSEEEVEIWIGHLDKNAANRKTGAARSAVSRRANTESRRMQERENVLNMYHKCKPNCTCALVPCPYERATLCNDCGAVISGRVCKQPQCVERRKREKSTRPSIPQSTGKRSRSTTSEDEPTLQELRDQIGAGDVNPS